MSALIQGSDVWLEWRNHGIGGSDAPVIMGVSPWMTAYELWEIKTGKREQKVSNWAMKRGTDMEPIARQAYEEKTGHIMEPVCLTHPQLEWMRASLDGITLEGDLALEIKCPGRDDHATTKAGKVPDKYVPQVQHILAVSGAKSLHYWSFDGEEGVLVEVLPDDLYINCLIEEEQRFWECICTDTPPKGAPRNDDAWVKAAKYYRDLKREHEALEALLESAKQSLIDLGGGYGAGVSCQKVTTKGSIDYKSIPALKGLDLEPYRKKSRADWRITLEKDQ